MNQRRGYFSRGITGLLYLLAVLTVPVTGHALTFTVNSTVDAVDATIGDGVCQTATVGQCTLRAAVQEANFSAAADDIVLPAGTFTLTLGGAGEDAAVTGDLDIGVGVASTLTIIGQGETLTIIDGNGADRVFETITNGTSVTMRLVTIRNGNSGGLAGGCILVGGNSSLTLNDVVVTGCTAAVQGGGGIDNGGTLTMNVVAVTNNTSQGINNGAAGTIAWTNGELSGHTDRGINNHGTLTLTNVTISGNTTAGNGAGIDTDHVAPRTVALQNVTISGNTSSTVGNIGGIRQDGNGTLSVVNTIISGNAPLNCGGVGTITSQGNNLTDIAGCGLTQPTDIVNPNPLLGALALNGGELRTHALLTGSPAIDAGTATGCPTTDARKLARPVDGKIPLDGIATCDIGAFEFRPQAITLTPPSVAFGTVTVGLASTQTVTATNAGDGNLTISPVIAANPLTPSFSITAETCSAVPLARAQTCTITVQFLPTATVASSHTFHVLSNDPATPDVTFAVSGTGAVGPAPNISVTDSIAPAGDLEVAFGGVVIGSTKDATVTVSNTGNASLAIGTLAATGVAAPFSITSENCSGLTIVPNASCSVAVRFSPTANTTSAGYFAIPSNDPGTPLITVKLVGSGVTAAAGDTPANNPPSIPALVSPENGASVAGTTVTLSWNKATDPDGDTVTYQVSNCTNADFTGCDPVDVASAGTSAFIFAGLGSMGAGIILIGFMAGGGSRRSRKAMLMIVAVFLTGTLFMSCRSKGGDDAAPPVTPTPTGEVSHAVTGLAPAATYYWKVVAKDGKGGTATSEVRSYTTQ